MSSTTLLSAHLPVTILPPADTLPSSPPTTPSTPLSATLVYNALSTTLTLTLSDLSTRLLLLSTTLTPALYAPLRAAHSLRLDFAAFPARLVELLRLPASDPTYVLQLHLPERLDPERAAPVPLRLVHFSAYKAFLHVDLPLRPASKEELVSALAARAREADAALAAAREACALADQRKAQLDESQAELARLRAALQGRDDLQRLADAAERRVADTSAQRESLTKQLAESDNKVHALQTELAELTARVAALPVLRETTTAAERRAAAAEEGLADARSTAEALRGERDAARAEATAGKERETRLQEELQTARAKGKVKAAVIGKQEMAVRAAEKRVAGLEREVRRMRDRAAMMEVEKEGLSGRLSSACSKLEENQAVLQSDQQVIEYLSRELNERLVGGEWEEAERGRRRETGRSGSVGLAGAGDDSQRDLPVSSL